MIERVEPSWPCTPPSMQFNGVVSCHIVKEVFVAWRMDGLRPAEAMGGGGRGGAFGSAFGPIYLDTLPAS